MPAQMNYHLSPDTERAFGEYLRLHMPLPHFANARSVRNALGRALLRQANRLFASSGNSLTQADLITLEAKDILASRVAAEGRPDDDPAPTT